MTKREEKPALMFMYGGNHYSMIAVTNVDMNKMQKQKILGLPSHYSYDGRFWPYIDLPNKHSEIKLDYETQQEKNVRLSKLVDSVSLNPKPPICPTQNTEDK